jgi:hypothetical protein
MVASSGRGGVARQRREDSMLRPGSTHRTIYGLIDGVWHDGTLEAWRRSDGRWRGYVRWSVGVGMRHLGWVDQEQLRPVKAT